MEISVRKAGTIGRSNNFPAAAHNKSHVRLAVWCLVIYTILDPLGNKVTDADVKQTVTSGLQRDLPPIYCMPRPHDKCFNSNANYTEN
jgi:hypothetical protein